MSDRDRSLEALHVHSETLALGDDAHGVQWAAHVAVLDRLAAMRRGAEAAGWTALAIERDGRAGRFRLFGIPPGGTLRTLVLEVPDRAAEEAPDA